jgi:mRNA interferase HicA
MMTRLPTLTARKIIKALDEAGFEVERQTGSHVILRNPETRRTTCVPLHGKDVKRSLMKEILRQAGLSEDEFRKGL